jgi:uncharacterized membrane protein
MAPEISIPVPPGAGSDWFGKFTDWVKEDWLMKLGALLLLIGFGWFTSYAFMHNWIGPMGRVALGLIAGALFIILGWFRIQKFTNQGGIFLVLGSTIILLVTFAAREIYEFFTPSSALAVMFLSTVFVGVASVKYKNSSLALASIILAGIAPLLTNAPKTDYIGLFSYLFIVVCGTVWVVALTGQRSLSFAALLLVSFYSAPHVFSLVYSDENLLLLFAYAFSAVFFITNIIGILKLKGKEAAPDLITAAGTGIFLLTWVLSAAQDEWKSLIISAWMVVFASGAYLSFMLTQRKEPFYVYAGVCLAMLAAATAEELQGAALTIAYTIECAGVVFASFMVLKDIKMPVTLSMLFAGPVILSFESIGSSAWNLNVFNEDFFVLFIICVSLFTTGYFFLKRVSGAFAKDALLAGKILVVAGSIYAYIILWLSLHTLFINDDMAVMLSLLVYTVVGLAVYFKGAEAELKSFRLYGGSLLGFVVARLLTVDVWKMELTGKIITFFLIGTLLIATAFLSRKKDAGEIKGQ